MLLDVVVVGGYNRTGRNTQDTKNRKKNTAETCCKQCINLACRISWDREKKILVISFHNCLQEGEPQVPQRTRGSQLEQQVAYLLLLLKMCFTDPGFQR